MTLRFDDNELFGVFLEIEDILEKHDYDGCILQGDLNWDMSRSTGFSTCMQHFIDRIGLVSVWNKFPVGYTHVHTDLTSTSTLDHFLVNERLLSLITDAGPLHLGDNLSRHSPIMLKLNIGSIPKQNSAQIKSVSRPLWYKADEQAK